MPGSISTPDNPTGEHQPRPTHIRPLPRQLGFREIRGRDVLPKISSHDCEGGMKKIANMSIDNTAAREGRWEGYIGGIDLIAGDLQQRREAVTMLQQLKQRAATQAREDPALIDVLDFAQSIIGNFDNVGTLKHILQRAKGDALQESIAQASDRLYIGNPDLSHAVYCAMELARDLYSQEHGSAYQTAEQKKEFEEMKERVARTRVS